MKKSKSFSIAIVFLFILFSGCKETTNALSDREIQDIKAEVMEAFNQSKIKANAHDSDAIIQYFWNNDDLVYAANGMLIIGWSNFKEAIKAVHLNPQNQDFRLEFENTYVKVINRDCALVTGKGKLIDFPTEEGPVDKNLTVTFLFEKIDGKWLVTAGHESGDFSL
jgi:uncharacterized protein (TIGR02246 family)